ncbi:hypothetical protein BDD12DRAFT_740254, partial [Trichophaea hybrida]
EAPWVSEPNGRGTINILQSSVITLFLCVYTSIPPIMAATSRGVTQKAITLILMLPQSFNCFNLFVT